MQKLISVPDIGAVLVSKKSNATKLKLKIHPEKGVLVTIPNSCSYSEAVKFVNSHIEWIKEKTSLVSEKFNDNLFTPESIFLTRSSKIAFEVDARIGLTADIEEDVCLFKYNPLKIDFNNPDIQTFVKKVINRMLLFEAYEYLTDRYSRLASQHNLFAKDLTIGTASTRWGTCNSRNEIRLSCRLMLLPDHLIDYIILHEMSHLVHKNHGKTFYEMLNKLTDNQSDKLNKELKKYSIEIKPGDYSYT